MPKFKTRLQELLGVELPIIGGVMMDLSTPPFVAAISNAGALGIICTAMFQDYDLYKDAISRVKDSTDKPFGININLFPIMRKLDNLKYLEIAAEAGVKIVETSGFSPPEDLVAQIKARGFVWMHKCVGVRYAKKAEALGADAVTVVGYENGGASGNLNIGTLILVPSTVQAVKIPVVGGGGVMDGRTFLAVLSLGAVGAIIGTRLMLSDECPLHRKVKEALLTATELDTDIIMRSLGFAHRVWMNTPAKKAAEIESRGGTIEELFPYISGEAARKMFSEGELDAGTISCSQGIGLVHAIKPVKDILQEITEDAAAIHGALLG
jgi:NADH:quinone reductase (non-electrogenic)